MFKLKLNKQSFSINSFIKWINIRIIYFVQLWVGGIILDAEHIFELYDLVKKDLKFLITSDVRVKILLSLNNGSKNLGQLRNDIHLSSSTILHSMNKLEEKKYIFRESGNYYLSQTGEISTNKLIDVIKAAHALKNCGNLFLNHDIESIPLKLLKDIGCLENATIIKSTYTDIIKPYNVLSELLSETRNVRHLSSVFFTSNIQSLLKNQEKTEKVHLLFTEEIITKLSETIEPDILQEKLSSGDLSLGVINDDIRISLTLGDNFVTMGLFSTEGSYDLNTFLISKSKEAINWGERLFNYHLKSALQFENL